MKRKSLLFLLLFALIAPWTAQAQETLTVYDGSATNGYIPVYGFYADAYNKAEMIMPAADLEDMTNGTISKMTWYLSSPAAEAWNGNFQVYLKEVDNTTFTTFLGVTDATLVWEGPLDGTGSTIELTFANNYTYTGGNLFIAVYQSATGTYKSASFAGETVTNASISNYSYSGLSSITSGTVRSFLPKTTFTYTPGAAPTCAKPTNLAVSYEDAIATATWDGEASLYNIEINGETQFGVTSPYTFAIEPNTTYTVKVQADCGGGDLSGWTTAPSFTTPCAAFALPYEYGFEDPADFGCWTMVDCDASSGISSSSSYVHTGSAAFCFVYNTNPPQYLISPEFEGATIGLDVSFYYKNSSTSWPETFQVGYSTTDNAISAFTWGDEITASDGQWTLYENSFPAGTKFVAVKLNSNDKLRLCLDDFTFEAATSCRKPTNIVVNYTGGDTAEVTWEGEARSYNIDVNGTVIAEGVTSPYPLTDLELATTYEVSVQSVCPGDDLSDFSTPVSFTTDFCLPEDMCAISFELADSYGDGWNGASIDVYDFDTISENLTLLSTFTLETGTSSGDFTLNVCDGRYLVFFWTTGSYDSECSYAVYDNLGDKIFSGSGAMDDYEVFIMNCNSTCRTPANFEATNISGHTVDLAWEELGEATSWTLVYMAETDTVVTQVDGITTNPYTLSRLTPLTTYYAMIKADCDDTEKWSDVISWTMDEACPKPHITVDATPTSALVSWTGFADDYEFEWAEMPETTSKDALWLQYDNGTMATGIGNGSTQYTWTWGVMYPATMLEGNGQLSKVSIYETAQYNTEDITINIYSGGDDAPGTLIYTETVTPAGVDGFHEITLAEVVTIDPTQNLWITLTEYGYYVIAACEGTESNNDWVDNGGWAHIGDLASSLAGYNWMIRGYVEPAYDPSTIVWTLVDPAVSPVTLDNLEPNTTYIVRIKALCGGEDGESAWTTVTFTTPDPCTTPFDLAVNDTTATSANLSWTGYQENYNLNYRYALPVDPTAPATIILEAHDVWGDGSGYQMLLDADATAYGDIIPETGNLSTKGSGEDAPAEVYAQFEYKIPVEADGALTTTNMVADGSVTIQIPAGTYDWCITNPTPGDCMYIAANGGNVPARNDDYVFEPGKTYHFTMQLFGSGDGAALEIIQPMSEWITVENIPNPYAFTGLTPKTAYEWQVQGVNCSEGNNTEWSEIATFTTTEQTDLTQTIALGEGQNWVSFYVDIELEDLETALTDALGTSGVTITIQSQTQQHKFTRGRWNGAMDFSLAAMYRITVPSACEIAVTGEPIDPAMIQININPGSNWIAFPFAESMTLTDAFAGFAITNDQVSSQTASSKFQRNKWNGQLANLEPGQGYIYKSPSDQVRPFTYQVSAKDAPRSMGNVVELKQVKRNTVDIEIAPVAPRMSPMEILNNLKIKK